jgi:hypothetical protein
LARSYTHVRVNFETVGWANKYESLVSSSPPSIIAHPLAAAA